MRIAHIITDVEMREEKVLESGADRSDLFIEMPTFFVHVSRRCVPPYCDSSLQFIFPLP